jgi:long-chain acyl-CoA synthetase
MSTGAKVETPDSQSRVFSLIRDRVEKFATSDALKIKEGTETRSVTFSELSARTAKLSSYLLNAGEIKPGDKIAILSESCPEWAVTFFAAVRSGATIVPLDIKLTEHELTSILSDCRPVMLFSDSKHAELASKLPQKIDSIKHVYFLDAGKGDQPLKTIDELVPVQTVKAIERSTDEVALIVYTSGTTGNPKGVMTTFGNLLFQVSRFEALVGLGGHDNFLSILPLNHLFELTGGFLGVLNAGGTVVFCHSLFPQEIIRTMREEKITGMIAVPLFFKSLKGGIEREIKKRGEGELERFHAGLEKAAALPLEQRRKLFAPVLESLGGQLRVLVSGGAPLDPEVAVFFENLGIPMIQGYGLTETSPVISANSLDANRIGSVGRAIPGVEVKLEKKTATDTEGEIITKGPHIMKGYYRREDLTNEVIDSDGWFHTGDIGHIDDDGFIFITGRIKNMIVLGGGKKIFPEEVETCLAQCADFKETCVIGYTPKKGGFKEGTEDVFAVVVPSDALAEKYKDDAAALAKAVQTEVNQWSEQLASYKRPAKIVVRLQEFEKTATRKIKRNLVKSWLEDQGY